jgi:SPX domain protein involved in polyphosphate accumulation
MILFLTYIAGGKPITASLSTISVFRQELKFSLDHIEMIKLKSILSGLLPVDKHNGSYGYMIRSLYFDSYSDTDYYAKISSEDNRKKIRLRTYDPESSMLKLEMKRKENGNQLKSVYPITKYEAKCLINCDYEAISARSDTKEIYNIIKLNRVRPVVLTEYRRFAYVHPACNIRITFDTEMKSSESSFDIFDKNAVMTPVDISIAGVLEVKYEEFLPAWIREILSEYTVERTAYSKYTASRSLFEKYLA